VNLPPEATAALVDFLSASRRYGRLLDAIATCHLEPPHPAIDEGEACVRDAEQALIAIFTAVLGEPDVHFPGEDAPG
jgi:hypothetical protein